MRVELVAATVLRAGLPDGLTDGEAAIAHAALSTEAPEAVLSRLIDDSRTDLLAHASATLHIFGVSRTAAAGVRAHEGFAVQQRDEEGYVVPPLVAEDEALASLLDSALEHAEFVRRELLDGLEQLLDDEPNQLARRKRATEAARALEPAALATQLVVTGSFAAWRGFVEKRTGEYEDAETRTIALACLEVLQSEAPLVFGDLAPGERR